jgi:hypothetical protein
MYKAAFKSVAITAVQDLFEIVAPADAAVVLHEVSVGQESDTDSEQLSFSIQRAGSSGSGGSAVTPQPMEGGMPAFGGTVEANNTTRAGTLTMLHIDAASVINGWHYLPTPETRIVVSPAERIIIGLETAPADELTMHGTVTFEVIGG